MRIYLATAASMSDTGREIERGTASAVETPTPLPPSSFSPYTRPSGTDRLAGSVLFRRCIILRPIGFKGGAPRLPGGGLVRG